VLILFGLISFHQLILKGAGSFLAPTGKERAEVVVLEGTQVIKKGALNAGIRFLFDGKARSMVVVLHQPSNENQVLALQERYPHLILNELEHVGLEKEKVQVILAPIDGHPITLTEARFVANKLSDHGVRSAILFWKDFKPEGFLGVTVRKEPGWDSTLSHIPILSIKITIPGGMMSEELVTLVKSV
jgi:hypothetical protein